MGYRERVRDCTQEERRKDCSDFVTEQELCMSKPCENTSKFSSWTPWLQVGEKSLEGNTIERRYRVECNAAVESTDRLQVEKPYIQERTCTSDGECL